MKLSIIGCPDKKRFRPYIKRAALFYAGELLTPKMRENVFIKIKFNSKIDAFGYASVEDYNDSGKPRDFLIELYPHLSAYDILKTLAHEMVHVKQYAYSEMNEEGNRWKGNRVDLSTIDYWTEPWEIEAHGMEPGLFTKFAIKEKLWDVFDYVQDPDSPIVPEMLGFKEDKSENIIITTLDTEDNTYIQL